MGRIEGFDRVSDLLELAGDSTDKECREVRSIRIALLRLAETTIKTQSELAEAQRLAAVAQATQSLAHDVRRPFSMIKGLLSILQSTKDSHDFKELIEQFVPEVNRAITSVNGMISDVMEVGAKSKLVTEPTKIESLLDAALLEVFRYAREGTRISFTYNLVHTSSVNVDALKVVRVFANIFANALQAMKGEGKIWIKTRDVLLKDRGFVEFCLGNGGSHIPEKDLENLFEAFFTRNKSGGTGLGLAIAKKIVKAHGGEIRCNSSKRIGVEFLLTLPAFSEYSIPRAELLPKSSAELAAAQNDASSRSCSLVLQNEDEGKLIESLRNALEKRSRPLKVAVVDDESIYQKLVKRLIESVGFSDRVEVLSISTPEDALNAIQSERPEISLIDVDLGDTVMNGFDVVEQLRSVGYQGKMCVNSNRGVFDYQSVALESGADLFLPKPLSLFQLIRLLVSVCKSTEKLEKYGQRKLSSEALHPLE